MQPAEHFGCERWSTPLESRKLSNGVKERERGIRTPDAPFGLYGPFGVEFSMGLNQDGESLCIGRGMVLS
jgi:hypothetical protein